MALIVDAWPGLRLIERVVDGSRNEVWRGTFDDVEVSVRRSRRSADSLAWELDVLERVAAAGVGVPEVVTTADGRRSANGVVVQRWISGSPPAGTDDWRSVAATLAQVHQVVVPQRPAACLVTELSGGITSIDADVTVLPPDVRSLVLEVFASMEDVPSGLIHGDPGASNIRIDEHDRVWLLDWDESRVDLTWHDLSELGVQVLGDVQHRRARVLSHAWEAVNAWTAEPEYARRRLRRLRESVGAD